MTGGAGGATGAAAAATTHTSASMAARTTIGVVGAWVDTTLAASRARPHLEGRIRSWRGKIAHDLPDIYKLPRKTKPPAQAAPLYM